MKKFLEYVAKDIIEKYCTDLSKIAIVFPNKRASLFMNEYLGQTAQKTIWAPAYITISELFLQHSPLTLGDPIKLICDLHKSFTECTGIDESLDHFFGWGQLLISDFDDIDKNMADASKVFCNVKDIHEFDDISYLDDEQKTVLKRFFSNFTANDNTELKKRFMKLWCHLDDIYNNFRARLLKQNIAYEGMLYREVVSDKSITYNYHKYIFIGFNLIQKVEQELFSSLQKQDKARFYWDFDKYYMPKATSANEAGHYISQFLKTYPNELDTSNDDIYDNFNKRKKITYINASTENIQARYINEWLRENDRYKHGRATAIILCDESLLPSVVHNIPKEVESLNITTGYPLFQTTISSFVLQLLELSINGYSPSKGTFNAKSVMQILSHPYSKYISDKCQTLIDKLKAERIYHPTPSELSIDKNLQTLFCAQGDNKALTQWVLEILKNIAPKLGKGEKDPLSQEAIFRMFSLCNRLNELAKSGDLDVDAITMQRLVTQLIKATSIPFHGEPIEGVQIMGILETRNIDFDNVLLLSCNEGNMPKGINDSSFIPYSIRKAHGLTTIDNKVAVYAYYFYNILQRATEITITYNNSTESGQTGEMSRFMLQLLTESDIDIKRISLQSELRQRYKNITEIKKNDQITKALAAMDRISPTSINRYLRCQLQFYYNNIALIREPDDNGLDEMSGRIFGNVFHLASEILYSRIGHEDGMVTDEDISYALKHNDLITRIVDEAFSEILFGKKINRQIEYNGLQLINREVIIKYIHRLLEIDKRLTPFKINDTESSIYMPIKINTNTGERRLRVGGRIDRLDQIHDNDTGEWRIRVIDYKTGRFPTKSINSLEDLFATDIDADKHADYFLQTMLYATAIRNDDKYNPHKLPVSPALMFIQHTPGDDYDPTISIGKKKVLDIAEYAETFTGNLSKTLSDIFDTEKPFTPTKDKTICATCPYRRLCGI